MIKGLTVLALLVSFVLCEGESPFKGGLWFGPIIATSSLALISLAIAVFTIVALIRGKADNADPLSEQGK
jgi:hypothetical protein